MVDYDYPWPEAAHRALSEYSVEREGMVAAMCGLKLSANPYPQESGLWQTWNEGWFDECPKRGEFEEDRKLRETRHKAYLRKIKRTKAWEYLRPATAEERAEWAEDPNPPMQTGLRRWKALQKQKSAQQTPQER